LKIQISKTNVFSNFAEHLTLINHCQAWRWHCFCFTFHLQLWLDK